MNERKGKEREEKEEKGREGKRNIEKERER